MNRSRNLTRLVLVHVAVVVASPAIATLLFLCLTLDLGSSMHFGGVLAFGFGVMFSYLFYGAKTLLVVLLASPILCGVARVKSGAIAFFIAAVVGAGVGWMFGQILMAGEDQALATNAKLAVAITGILAAMALEFAWRDCPPSKPNESVVGTT